MGAFSHKSVFLLLVLVVLSGCSTEKFSRPDIKNDFCGVHINRQYCQCAFHNEYCDNIGMSKKEANNHVNTEYEEWVAGLLQKWQAACALDGGIPDDDACIRKYGVVEMNGNLYLNSKPGDTLIITTEDLPEWARGKIATIGATIAVVGPPDTIKTGDVNVILDGLPIARVNDTTAQGGVIVEGSTNIFVNGRPVAIIGGMTVSPMVTGVVPHVGGPILSNVGQ